MSAAAVGMRTKDGGKTGRLSCGRLTSSLGVIVATVSIEYLGERERHFGSRAGPRGRSLTARRDHMLEGGR